MLHLTSSCLAGVKHSMNIFLIMRTKISTYSFCFLKINLLHIIYDRIFQFSRLQSMLFSASIWKTPSHSIRASFSPGSKFSIIHNNTRWWMISSHFSLLFRTIVKTDNKLSDSHYSEMGSFIRIAHNFV